MIIGFLLPKRRPRTSEELIGAACRGPLQPAHNFGEGMFGSHDHMNVIRHHHPGMQPVPVLDGIAVAERIGGYSGDGGFGQPTWTVGFPPRTGKSPSYEDCRLFGNPVWEMSLGVGHSVSGRGTGDKIAYPTWDVFSGAEYSLTRNYEVV